MPVLVQDRILARPAMCQSAVPSLILAAAAVCAFGGFLSTVLGTRLRSLLEYSRVERPPLLEYSTSRS